uniref:Uncharacterized protein n=1 Tax=Plectus sambesii TaxID=2011161 RepID=A0A914XTC2_9BILA
MLVAPDALLSSNLYPRLALSIFLSRPALGPTSRPTPALNAPTRESEGPPLSSRPSGRQAGRPARVPADRFTAPARDCRHSDEYFNALSRCPNWRQLTAIPAQ